MSQTKNVQTKELHREVNNLPHFTSSALATQSSKIAREVIKRGASVITKHNEPAMILMTIDRYLQLERASGQNLDTLTQEFDAMYAQMQKPGVARKTVAALDLKSQK